MKALVIKSKDKTELKFIRQLLSKMGVSSSMLDIEEMEDLGMSILMKDVDRKKKVNRETIIKKLNAY